MQVQVLFESSSQETDQVRDLATRRTSFALRRLIAFEPRAQLRLSDVCGRRGRLAKRCQVKLDTDGAGVVIATSIARDWRAAVDEALTRAVRRLIRLSRRSWENHRLRSRPPAVHGSLLRIRHKES